MKFHPTKDYLLVKPVAVQETKSGLILVKGQSAQQPQAQATMVFAEVLKAGPEVDKNFHYETGFEVGEVVAFHPGAGQVINDGVNDFVLVKATAVVARVEDFSTTVSVLS